MACPLWSPWGRAAVWGDLALAPDPRGARPGSKGSRAGPYLMCVITNCNYDLVCLIKTTAISRHWIS